MSDELTKTKSNAISTSSWLGEYINSPDCQNADTFLEWMHAFIERIQQSSYSDGYLDGVSNGKPF